MTRDAAANPVYLDHAATTPLRAEVAAIIEETQAEAYANPTSQHSAGRRARQLLEDARERILAAVGGRVSGPVRDRLVFTSGATESNTLALRGMANAAASRRDDGRPRLAAFSARDHSSVRRAMESLHNRGWLVTEVPLDAAGRIDARGLAAWADEAATAAAAILATTVVCGQTGVCEDPALPASVPARVPGGLVHADATQGWALVDGPFSASGAATMTLAPHKFGGPRGIGGLLIRGDVAVEPDLHGTKEYGLRPGTEPVPLAVGFAGAVELGVRERAAAVARVAGLRARFEAGLLAAARTLGVAAEVIAADAERGPHISTVAFCGIDRQAFVMAADLAGVCCATGAACSSGSSEPAPALVAMGLPAGVVQAAVRFSFGSTTTAADVDAAVARLEPVLRRIGRGQGLQAR